MKHKIGLAFLLLLAAFLPPKLYGQENILINLAPVDGLDLTPDNIFQYQIQSGLKRSSDALIKGTIRYRNSDMRISYQFSYTLQPGINIIDTRLISPRFTYSSAALKELFEQYKKLPEGIYEYCVSVQPDYHSTEIAHNTFSECLYHKSADVFLINLVDPEDKARIYDYHPMLTWTVNYPFAAALTYRIRVADIKKGQNVQAAIARNNPVYDERNLAQTGITYPLYAKPLEKNQPYAWTVDAYYKGILLGSAAPWQFTIIEDSLLSGIPKDPSFVDISRETGKYSLYAPGVLKLKYDLQELKTDSLTLRLLNKRQEPVPLKDSVLHAVYGDNRFIIDFKEHQPLKHLQPYTLLIQSQTGSVYRILFKYVNPELLK